MAENVDHDSVDGAWEDVVRRISERLRPDGGPAPTHGQLTAELVALERRALEAEDMLVRERHRHAEKLREREAKLRRLEPWLRRLKGQYEEICRERDSLADQLGQITSACDGGVRVEHEALDRELAAALAARDAAIAESQALRTRIENDEVSRSEAVSRRIAAAETARDDAQERLLAVQRRFEDARRAAEGTKQLRIEIDQTQQTVAAHKAVARASQEEAAKLRDRVGDLERRCKETAALLKRKTRENERLESRLESKVRKLLAAREALDEVRNDLDVARSREEELERAIEKLDEEAAVADDACAEASGLRRTVEKLRQETAEAKQTAARLAEESRFSRRTGGSAHEELVACRVALDTACNDVERLERELAAAGDRADEAERAVADMRAELEEARAQLGVAVRGQEDASSRATDLAEELRMATSARDEAARRAEEAAGEASAADEELSRLRVEIENAKSALGVLEAENKGLGDALAAERDASRTCVEAFETSASSQVQAARSRQEAEIGKLRVRAEAAELRLREIQAATEALAAARHHEMQRIHLGVSAVMSESFQRLIDGMEHVLGPDMGLPSGSFSDSAVGAAGAPDWERLMDDLADLRSEVEDFREVDVPTPQPMDDLAPTATPTGSDPAHATATQPGA